MDLETASQGPGPDQNGSQLPPWLKPERFEDPNCNPEAVVADLRRHVSSAGQRPKRGVCLGPSDVARRWAPSRRAVRAAAREQHAARRTSTAAPCTPGAAPALCKLAAVTGAPEHRKARAAGVHRNAAGAGAAPPHCRAPRTPAALASAHAHNNAPRPAKLPHRPQLVEVINQDFGDYVALAPRLSAVDGSVVRMKQPLLDIKVRRLGGAAWGNGPAGALPLRATPSSPLPPRRHAGGAGEGAPLRGRAALG